jgi:GntR family transcriptional regulator
MSEGRTTSREIAEHLRAAIARGEYGPGAKLPSRSELVERFGVAAQTVTTAIDTLRAEGLVVGVTGSGWYVRERPPMMRLARSRLSRAERAAGRGTFTTDAHDGGWTPRVDVEIHIEAAGHELAATLDIEPGSEVLVRDRTMFADVVPVQLAVSYLPRRLTVGTRIEAEDTGPGGVYARLEEVGHRPLHFTEAVRIGRAAPSAQPVEVNRITALGERYELYYELPAE